jgi:hypothetical protein
MNYTLHFKPKTAGKHITQQQLKEYFTGRGSYTVNDYQRIFHIRIWRKQNP